MQSCPKHRSGLAVSGLFFDWPEMMVCNGDNYLTTKDDYCTKCTKYDEDKSLCDFISPHSMLSNFHVISIQFIAAALGR